MESVVNPFPISGYQKISTHNPHSTSRVNWLYYANRVPMEDPFFAAASLILVH